ncbi:MAG: hypothetical protein Q8K78_08070 [Planctomycetaceae bacterium]|nr:hypothetical protein [Planctomycetaceae bacterium]
MKEMAVYELLLLLEQIDHLESLAREQDEFERMLAADQSGCNPVSVGRPADRHRKEAINKHIQLPSCRAVDELTTRCKASGKAFTAAVVEAMIAEAALRASLTLKQVQGWPISNAVSLLRHYMPMANSADPQDPSGGADATGGKAGATDNGLNADVNGLPTSNVDPELCRFVVQGEIVQICGFGESVSIERTKGIDRLIAIVTRGRVGVLELARMGAAQRERILSSDTVDADRLSERETVKNERFEPRLGEDTPSKVKEAVHELIEDRNAAKARGDAQEQDELTKKINAVLQPAKSAVNSAAGTVRKSLDRTYERLGKGEKGVKLATHFQNCVERRRGEADFVYVPDESHGKKIIWEVK